MSEERNDPPKPRPGYRENFDALALEEQRLKTVKARLEAERAALELAEVQARVEAKPLGAG